jgi:hypothetical protein
MRANTTGVRAGIHGNRGEGERGGGDGSLVSTGAVNHARGPFGRFEDKQVDWLEAPVGVDQLVSGE